MSVYLCCPLATRNCLRILLQFGITCLGFQKETQLISMYRIMVILADKINKANIYRPTGWWCGCVVSATAPAACYAAF
jgi:hypothetical protein